MVPESGPVDPLNSQRVQLILDEERSRHLAATTGTAARSKPRPLQTRNTEPVVFRLWQHKQLRANHLKFANDANDANEANEANDIVSSGRTEAREARGEEKKKKEKRKKKGGKRIVWSGEDISKVSTPPPHTQKKNCPQKSEMKRANKA